MLAEVAEDIISACRLILLCWRMSAYHHHDLVDAVKVCTTSPPCITRPLTTALRRHCRRRHVYTDTTSEGSWKIAAPLASTTELPTMGCCSTLHFHCPPLPPTPPLKWTVCHLSQHDSKTISRSPPLATSTPSIVLATTNRTIITLSNNNAISLLPLLVTSTPLAHQPFDAVFR